MDSMRTTVGHVYEGTAPPIAEVLLADARALPAVPGVVDPLRDLLFYAIALEVKVKTRLRELASPDNLGLVEAVIANPREVTQSPPQLLHTTCLALTGRSLSQEDNRLFKDVERLFKHRNAVAHRGKLPASDRASDYEETTRRVFDWLDGLMPTQ
jgi:hypothetical protein